jgi:glucose-1-phosphate thymidylyltransferase
MKGIVLAGGSGTRLYPSTLVISKQLLPVYDKPMIYYPISVLMMSNIRDILIISTPSDTPRFKELLGDGSNFGVHFSYSIQPRPQGLAQALIIGEDFLKNDSCCLILGDNIFYGNGLIKRLNEAVEEADKGFATVFGYYVNDPKRFGIVELDNNGKAISIEEKPKEPKSNFAVTGLYFYPSLVSFYAKKVIPSKRGELEITTLNNMYLAEKKLMVQTLGRGFSWLDTGTTDSLNDASNFVRMIENHQSLKICCPEEIAYMKKWISQKDIRRIGKSMEKNEYGQYLLMVANDKIVY